MFPVRDEYKDIPCEGNHCLEGFAYDLIDGIANILHFKYEFRLVAGNKYGAYNKETKKWDGLVKELLDHVSMRLTVHLHVFKTATNEFILYFRMPILPFAT